MPQTPLVSSETNLEAPQIKPKRRKLVPKADNSKDVHAVKIMKAATRFFEKHETYSKSEANLVDNFMVTQETKQEEIEHFRDELGHTNPTGFTWLLVPGPLPEANLLSSIETILFSESYMNVSDKEEFFLKECRVTQSLRRSVHDMTNGQADNQNWLIARKYRLTSSKFGPVIAAYNRGKYPKYIFTNLLEGYDLNGVQAIQLGRENKRCA
ncbi:unnamed protein product [Diabrotica balteata]|uniref:Uncharacterized protein n=1 Tax=Diabrotica balteata TaxID=107213 RepID=A0A9N9TC75_DIABA|nr:unnamed protein product [Diabrotica balteata]